ncbi:MAG: TMEM175 family protein [Vulcanimicrobiaceae bacterium]
MRLQSTSDHSTINDTSRVEDLSDGVFAVALTLLVLDIQIPHGVPPAQLPAHVFALWPRLISFLLSFFVVGYYWVGHTIMFVSIRRTDRVLQWLNLAFLTFVVIVPLSADLLASYPDSRFAVCVYGANIILIGLAQFATWQYAVGYRRLTSPELDPKYIRLLRIRLIAMPVTCVLSIALSAVSILASVALYVLVPVLFTLPSRYTPYYSHVKREISG